MTVSLKAFEGDKSASEDFFFFQVDEETTRELYRDLRIDGDFNLRAVTVKGVDGMTPHDVERSASFVFS